MHKKPRKRKRGIVLHLCEYKNYVLSRTTSGPGLCNLAPGSCENVGRRVLSSMCARREYEYISARLCHLRRRPLAPSLPAMTTPSHRRVWATVLTNVSYLPGTLVLGYSLQLVKSRYPLVVLVTSAVSQEARDVLHKRGLQTRLVDYLTPSQGGPAFDAAVARFVDTWTKLR